MCRNGLSKSTEKTSSVATVAPIGITPPPSAFARHRMSGWTFSCSQANILPVRPMLVCTSSRISNAPNSSHGLRTAGKYPVGGGSRPFALNRPEDHRRDVVAGFLALAQHGAHGVDIAERHVAEARQQRHKGFAEGRFRGGRQRAQRFTVEGAAGGDEGQFTARRLIGFRQLDGRLYSIRYRCCRRNCTLVSRALRLRGFRQHRPQRVQQLLTVKRLFRELILDGGYHNWITVPYIEDAKPTKAVDKLLSLGVDKRI